jgi:hypothetical protein
MDPACLPDGCVVLYQQDTYPYFVFGVLIVLLQEHLEAHPRATVRITLDLEISTQGTGSLPHPPYPYSTRGECRFRVRCRIEASAVVFYLSPELPLGDAHSYPYLAGSRMAPDICERLPQDAQQLPASLS